MITKEIACRIYNCYSEIENANNMIAELRKRINDKGELELKDSWGRQKCLSLNIPYAEDKSYSVHQLPVGLALTVLTDHIKSQEAELQRLKGVCQLQLHE